MENKNNRRIITLELVKHAIVDRAEEVFEVELNKAITPDAFTNDESLNMEQFIELISFVVFDEYIRKQGIERAIEAIMAVKGIEAQIIDDFTNLFASFGNVVVTGDVKDFIKGKEDDDE